MMSGTIRKGGYQYTCCMDCKNRTVGCHSKCPDYLEVKANNEKLKREKIKPNVDIEEAYNDIKYRKYKKLRKWR